MEYLGHLELHVVCKCSLSYFRHEAVSEQLLTNEEKGEASGVLKHIEGNNSSKKLSKITFLVQQWMSAIFVQSLTNNTLSSKESLAVMMKALVENVVKSWLNFAELSTNLRKMIEEVITLGPHMMDFTGVVVDSEDLLAPVIELVKTEMDRQLEAKTQRDERYRRYVETTESIRARSNNRSERPPTHISDDDDKSNWWAYSTNEYEGLLPSTHK